MGLPWSRCSANTWTRTRSYILNPAQHTDLDTSVWQKQIQIQMEGNKMKCRIPFFLLKVLKAV